MTESLRKILPRINNRYRKSAEFHAATGFRDAVAEFVVVGKIVHE